MKAWLAFGDVFLAEHGLYHHLVAERVAAFDRYTKLHGNPSWADAYRRAVVFKFEPQLTMDVDLNAELKQLSALYAEAPSNMPCARIGRWWAWCAIFCFSPGVVCFC